MAKWVAYENRRSHVTLMYRNLISGSTFTCGELRRDTPGLMIVQWVVDQAAMQTGDLIKLPDGNVLQILPPHAETV